MTINRSEQQWPEGEAMDLTKGKDMQTSYRNLQLKNLAEVEKCLWHAQSHIANDRSICCSEHMTADAKEAMEMLYQAIQRVRVAE